MNKQEAIILKDRAGAIYGAVDHAKSIGDIDHRLAKDILEFTRLVKEYAEKPLPINEEAWNKITETAQSLDHAMYGHMDKKRKIPQIIAKYLELCKTDNFDFTEDYNLVSYDFINHFDTDLTIEEIEEIKMWFYDNDQKENQRRHILFLESYTYGYEVEKEPLYTVTINLDRKYHLALDEGDGDDEISTTLTTGHDVLGYRYFLTEKEIKAIDERYWPFAVPVEKVEE